MMFRRVMLLLVATSCGKSAGDTAAYDVDADGDGYSAGEDCDDSDPEVHPGAFDSPCDDVDADCDGEAPVPTAWVPEDHGTIGDALAAAGAEARICVAAGDYAEDLVFSAGDVALWAEEGPEHTVLRAASDRPAVITGGDVEIHGFTVQGSDVEDDGAAVAIRGGWRAVLHDNHFVGGSAGRGGAVAILEAEEVRLSANRFEAGVAAAEGGALYAEAAAGLVADGNDFENNQSGSCGGAVALVDSPSSWTGGAFEANTAAQGAALCVRGGSAVSVDSASYIGNTASSGGAVLAEDLGELELLRSDFSDNRGSAEASLRAEQLSVLRFEGNHLDETAGSEPLVHVLAVAVARVVDNTVEGSALGSTAAVRVSDSVDVRLEGNVLRFNEAAIEAGAIGLHLVGCLGTVEANEVVDNDSVAGIVLDTFQGEVRDNTVERNTGTMLHSGGLSLLASASVTLSGNILAENTAVVGAAQGAGLHSENSSAVTLVDGRIVNNTAVDGGGLMCSGGQIEIQSPELAGNQPAQVACAGCADCEPVE